MAEEKILAKKEDKVMTISLNRPEKRNAVTIDMAMKLEEAIDKAASDKETRVIVLRGEGQCFCSGIDYNALAELGSNFPTTPEFRYFLPKLQGIFNKLEALEKPVIAALHTYCYGLGLEMAMAADFRIAEEGVKIALQETELGFIPDVGGTTRLTRLVGIPMAKEIIMTSLKLDAKEAYDIRLVNEVAPKGGLDDAIAKWVERLAGCAPLAVGFAKKIIDRGAHLDKMSFMELEGYAQSTLLNTEDVKEGVMARFQKRKPEFKGK